MTRRGRGWPWWARLLIACLYALALAAIVHKGWTRRAVWRGELVDKGIGGDGIQYWAMAVHMEREHIVSLDGKQPTWLRLPGYPALLRYTTRPAESDEGPTDPKSIQVRVDAWLKRAVRVNLAVDLGCGVAAFLVGLALGAGPVALLAPLAWAYQPWSSVVAIHTLSDPLATLLSTLCLAALVEAVRRRSLPWLVAGGCVAGLAQYVRPDSILLLPVLVAAGIATAGWRRPARALAGVLVWAAVFAPWPVRNYELFHAFHPLGAPGVDAKGNPIDRGAAASWMRTWCVGRPLETVDVAWKFPGATVHFANIPPTAYDNADDILQLREFLLDYHARGARLDSELSLRLRRMAAERRARHPFDYWVRLPLQRIKLRLLPPRDGYGLGSLPAIKLRRALWEQRDRRVVLAGLAGLVVLLLRPATRRAASVAALWLVLRFVLIAWIPAPEPRYFLEALPLLVAAATTLPASLLAALVSLTDRAQGAARGAAQGAPSRRGGPQPAA